MPSKQKRSAGNPDRDGLFGRLMSRYTHRASFTDLDGSLLLGRDGHWWVYFSVGLETAFDWRNTQAKLKVFDRTQSLYRNLLGREAHIEVLEVPVGAEERVARIKRHEYDDRLYMENAPEWVRWRDRCAGSLADYLQDIGDRETRGYIGVRLESSGPRPSVDEAVEQFGSLSDKDRFYLGRKENYWLVKDATAVMRKLRAAWGSKVVPLTQDGMDVFLMALEWPGQPKVLPPRHQRGEEGNRELKMSYYGRSNICVRKPYELEVDYYGRTSYVSFVPISDPPLLQEYLPREESEYGFQATSDGRRIRFSFRFRVEKGDELLNRASRSMNDVKSHAENLQSGGGEVYTLGANIAIAEMLYKHLADGNPVVVGNPMLVVSDIDPNRLAEIREELLTANKSAQFTLEVDQQLQKRLWLNSRPGAKRRRANRHQVVLDIRAAAQSMPFVTSAPSEKSHGPDLLGFIRGREHRPFMTAGDIQLRSDVDKAPAWLAVGPSGSGKTTTLLDFVSALVGRGYVGLVDDLVKGDTAIVEGGRRLGIHVNHIDLADFPGGVNPATLVTARMRGGEHQGIDPRVVAMTDFLQKCCGTDWTREWRPELEDACRLVVEQADRHSRVPDLRHVYDRLRRVPKENGAHIASAIAGVVFDETVGPTFCHGVQSETLLDLLSQHMLHITQFQALRIPDEDIAPDDYSPEQRLAVAGLDLASTFGTSLAARRDLRVAMGKVEFAKAAQISKGRTLAEYIARVGRALDTVSILDTQRTSDLAPQLLDQITGRISFQPEDNWQSADELLEAMNMDRDADRNDWVRRIAEDREVENDNKGTALVRLPTREVVLMQGARYYVGSSFVTNQSERRRQKAASATSSTH